MIVQTHFPQKLSPKRYDQFLASGWFRGSVMLYKMDILCLENDLYSVINIRLNLEKHKLKRSLAKIERRAKAKFRVEIGPVAINSEKEELYELQKKKFQGFIHQTLRDFLYSGFRNSVFDTREISVYDGDKLVACSYFDLGEKSLASLLGIYDPEYKNYSLGIYTMIEEVNFAKAHGFKWYYPGYILNEDKGFEYKLRLGDYEFYNSNKRWSSFSNYTADDVLAVQLNDKNREIAHMLKQTNYRWKKWMYPYFGIGYMQMWDVEFIRTPILFELEAEEDMKLCLAYDLDSSEYQVFWCEHAKGHDHMINMALSSSMQNNQQILLQLYKYKKVLLKTNSLSEVQEFLK